MPELDGDCDGHRGYTQQEISWRTINMNYRNKGLCYGNCVELARNGTITRLFWNAYSKVSRFQTFLVQIESNFPLSPFSCNKRKFQK